MSAFINIPYKGSALIKLGEKVDFNTPFIKKIVQTEIKLPIAKKINVDPKKIFFYLKKFIGEDVKKGDLIAQKTSFFSKKSYWSDCEGIIKEINHQEGYLLISCETDKEDVINCWFKGEVAEINKNEVKIKVGQIKEFELKEVSGNFGGEVFYTPSPKAEITEEKINHKIILAESIISYNQIKMEVLGAKGFVTLNKLPEKTIVPWAKLKNIVGYQIILRLNFPYCIVNKKNNIIIFYN